jgi:hypothetical protein
MRLPNVKRIVEQVAQRAAYHQVIKTVNEYGMCATERRNESSL